MTPIIGCVSLVVATLGAYAYGETKLAEANGLPRFFPARLFPLFTRLYLAAWVTGVAGVACCIGLANA